MGVGRDDYLDRLAHPALVEVTADPTNLVDAAVAHGGPTLVKIVDRVINAETFGPSRCNAILVDHVDHELERLDPLRRVEYELGAFLVDEAGTETVEPGEHVLGVLSGERDGVDISGAVTIAVEGELLGRCQELVQCPVTFGRLGECHTALFENVGVEEQRGAHPLLELFHGQI